MIIIIPSGFKIWDPMTLVVFQQHKAAMKPKKTETPQDFFLYKTISLSSCYLNLAR